MPSHSNSTAMRYARGPALAVALFAACVFVPTSAGGTELTVDDDQMITVRGQSESLHDVVVALCTEARIDLLGFAATDRTVSLDYDNIPLDRFLSRLLREESYMVGLKGGDNGVRIAWLRVMGPEAGTSALRFGEEPPTSYFGVQEALVEDAWSNEDADARAAAVAAVVKHVRANPEAIGTFIAKGYGPLLEEIGDRPYAIELLQNLQQATDSNAEVFQLMGLIQSIRSRKENEGKLAKPWETLKGLRLPEQDTENVTPTRRPQP